MRNPMRIVVLAIETTGLDVLAGHRVVEIGCVELLNHVPTGKTWQTYLNPQRENEREAFEVHGLSDSFLARQPLFRHKAEEFHAFLQDSRIIIHNAEFGLKFLNQELFQEGYDRLSGERVVDSLHLARSMFPGQPNSLDALMRRFGIDATARTRHGALLKAERLAEVYLELKGGCRADLASAQHLPAREARPRGAPADELARHEAFLDQIDNAIWRRDTELESHGAPKSIWWSRQTDRDYKKAAPKKAAAQKAPAKKASAPKKAAVHMGGSTFMRVSQDDQEASSPLLTDENIELVAAKLQELRLRLLDSTRRNPLINIRFTPKSTSFIRVVDELPDILRHNLSQGRQMRLTALPALEDELPDEQTDEFQDALFVARQEDEGYLADIAKIDPDGAKAEEKLMKAERSLKDRLREDLGLPQRQTKDAPSLADHARLHGIEPSYILPIPKKDELHDGRHSDEDIQTLLLPDRLQRSAKTILEKGRSFERETGVNVLHVAFGLLEWKSPDENDRFVSPLLLLEIRIDRKQSPQGAEFYLHGVDQVMINTNLALKLQNEKKLVLPDYEGGSVEDYFKTIEKAAPSRWHWKVRREVCLGIFPSSKIAMYHDLDPKKRPLAEEEAVVRLLATTGVGDGAYAENYGTDDPEVTSKVPYVVMDADASQYSALVDVADQKNLAIEGPPGSGKSQTIVNLIASALADGKKVLFVAEKLTALDVVKNRLDAAGLGSFILPLQAGRGTAETVYESIEARLEMSRSPGLGRRSFDSSQRALERDRAVLQSHLDALGAMLGSTGLTVHQVIGHCIAATETLEALPREIRRMAIPKAQAMGTIEVEALVSEADAFGTRLGRITRIPVLWRASTAPITSHDMAEDFAETADSLARSLENFERDFADSSIAVFMTENPFVIDMKAICDLFSAAAREVGRVDLELLDRLTNPVARQAARDLCGQLNERKTLRAQLSHSLRDAEGSNVGKRLAAAADFARARHKRLDPELHRVRLAEIEGALADTREVVGAASPLPRSWTFSGRTLRDIHEGAKRIAEQSPDVLSLRRGDQAAFPMASVEAVAIEIDDTVSGLSTEIGRIQRALPSADGSHNPGVLRNAAATIDGAGFFARMGSAYRAARKIYTNDLGGGPAATQAYMARLLSEYADWLDWRRDFDNRAHYEACFGPHFQGLNTDRTAIGRVVTFHAICKEIAGSSADLKTYLQTGKLDPVLAFAELDEVPPLTFSQAKEKLRELENLAERERRCITEAEGHLELFRDKKSMNLSEIEEILARKTAESDLTRKIEESPARAVLGARFSGITTRTDLLDVECGLAEAIANTEYADLALEAIRSGRGDALAKEFETFAARRAKLESQVDNFAADLGLPENLSAPMALARRTADLREAAADPQSLLDRAQFKRAEDSLRGQGLGRLIDWAVAQGEAFDPARLAPIVRALIARSMADLAYKKWGQTLEAYDGKDFVRICGKIRSKDREMIELSRAAVVQKLLDTARPPAGNNVGRKSTFSDMSLIYNELYKKKRRISVRELTSRAGHALIELKPCWMMSPLAVAQYLHESMRFDLVVIDEASQMTPENAIGAISRADQSVIVGDTKQLPPTNFFQKMLDDSDTDEDLREDSESILDMANVAFMPVRQLSWHYRSRHSALIQFSNQWMYKGELTIFPSAQEDHPDLGVELIEVPGIYKGRRNEIEARAIVAAAVHHMTNRPELSLGICTMNSDQKELILDEFERERDRNPMVQSFVEKWEEENDALEEFFVKNIETIQGDERDVIMISTLYGPESPGAKVLQRFGPINSAHGHRRLNVLFTRAKRKIVTFTSMKPTDILVDDNKALGVQMFRAWLEYSKTGHIPDAAGPRGCTESPFEDYVAAQIERLGCDVVPQVGVAGFYIDLGVRHPDWPYGYILGVECDGAAYHSSKSSRDRDRLRQEVLEGLGWRLHRIWSTDWFRNPRAEIEALKAAIDDALADAKIRGAKHYERLDAVSLVTRLTEATTFGVEEGPSQNLVEPTLESAAPDSPAAPLKPDQASLRVEPSAGSDLSTAASRVAAASTVALGSKVKVENITEGKKLAFILVEGNNAPDKGIIGVHTPLGEALLDAQVGDVVEYQIGSYIKEVRVLEIR